MKNEQNINIEIGRWTITNNGITTKKENNAIEEFDKNDIWSYEKKGNFFVWESPVFLCSRGWISNIDLLDFNSAFLVYQELFEEQKPKGFPKVSWAETLKRQYKRFQNSLDINSFEGRKQLEYEKEYMEKLTPEEHFELNKIDLNKDYSKQIEVFGDSVSRKY